MARPIRKRTPTEKASKTKAPSSPMKKQRGVTAGIARGAETENSAIGYGRNDDNQDVSQNLPHLIALNHPIHCTRTFGSPMLRSINPPLLIPISERIMALWLTLMSSRAIPIPVPHAAARANYFVAMAAGALSTSLALILL